MTKTFADLKALDINGPFSIKPMKFLIILDDEGKYHVDDHQGIKNSTMRYFSPRSVKSTLARLGDCCLSAKKAYLDGWVNLNLENLISAREYILSSLKSFEALEPKTTLEAYRNLQSLLTSSTRGYKLVESFLIPGWEEEYGQCLEKEKERLVCAFKSLQDQSFIRLCAKGSFSLMEKLSASPAIQKSLNQAKEEAVGALVADERQFLIKVDPSSSPVAKTLQTLYQHPDLEPAGLLVVPVAVLEYLNATSQGLKDKTLLLGPIPKQAAEALNVLYRPSESGPYSNLTKAYKASLVL